MESIDTSAAGESPVGTLNAWVRVATASGTRRVVRGCRGALARVIREQVRALAGGLPEHVRQDAAIFFGPRLAAVVRLGPDGQAEVTRFGE